MNKNYGRLACTVALALTSLAPTATQAATITTQLVCTKAGVIENAAAVMGANSQTHMVDSDANWKASAVQDVRLKSTLTISKAGTYRLRGTIANGQVLVNVNGNGVVRLILAGASITSSSKAAIEVQAAPKLVVVLQAGTKNTITDGATRAATDNASGALYSKAPLTIMGSGSLRVNGRHGDGIAGTDGVAITGGNLSVTAMDDGIRGRDFVYVRGGTINVTAQSDGLRSTGKAASTVGYVYIGGGKLTVNAKAAGLHGISDVVVAGGTVRVTSVGNGVTSSCVSYLEKASLTIASGAKAIHSNGETVVHSGTLRVTKANEGLEGAAVVLTGGNINVNTADDGINVTTGAGSTAGTATVVYTNSVDPRFTMSAGTAVLNVLGDGLDINGPGTISGGKLIISGPTASKDGALDTLNPLVMSGGLLIGVGPSAFAMAPATSSSQPALLANVASQQAASLVQIADATGRVMATFKSSKPWQSVVFSSSALAKGQSYKVYVGGKASGTPLGGYTATGSLSGATLLGSFTAGDYTNPGA